MDFCRMGCDFYGSPKTDGLCSKCYKEQSPAPPKITPRTKALISAISKGHNNKVAETLLAEEDKPDITVILPEYYRCPHVNLVCVAAIKGHTEIIATLFHNNAELLKYFTKIGFNSLHLAAINNHPNVLRILFNLDKSLNSQTTNKHGATALHIASRLGHHKCTEQLIELGAEINSRDKNQLTPLMRAAECNQVECVKALLSHRADASVTTDAGWDVGHIVARKNSLEVLNVLKEKGHNFRKKNLSGLTSIDMSITYGHYQVFERILDLKLPKEKDLSNNDLDLIKSVVAGDTKAVHNALEKGANALIVLPEYLNTRNVNLICIAALEGKTEVIKPLHQHGASLNQSSKDGNHALHYAALNEHPQVINVLVELEVDVEIPTDNERGLTALHIASEQGHQSCVEQLINLDAKPNSQGSSYAGNTPLMLAAKENKVKCMEFLIANGAEASATDNYGMGAAHYAAKEGSVYSLKYALKLLVQEGLDVHVKDASGYTPLNWAEFSGCRQIVDYLRKVESPNQAPHKSEKIPHRLQEKLDRPQESLPLPLKVSLQLKESKDNYERWGKCAINRICNESPFKTSDITHGHYQDEKGWTILHHAADSNNEMATRILLQSNLVSVNVISFDQLTPVEVAKKKGNHNLANMLMKHSQKNYHTVQEMAQNFLETHNVKYESEEEEKQNSAIQKLNDRIKESIDKGKEVKDPDLYELLLFIITEDDNIEDVVKLLNIRCPTSPVGNLDVYALKLAIDLDRPKIISALIAVGADIFFRSYNCELLKYTWKSHEPTICTKMLITRMFDHRLRLEKKKIIYNRENLNEILDKFLHSITENPEKEMELNKLLSDPKKDKSYSKPLTALLCEAVESNCPILASFLHSAGAHVYTLNNGVKNAIHHSLDTNKDLEEMLLTNLGGSLYVADSRGKMPAENMGYEMKSKLEEKIAIAEFIKMENSLSSAKGVGSKIKIKKFALLFACLYVSYSNRDNKIFWKELFSYTFKLLSTIIDEYNTLDEDLDNKDDRLTWIDQLCQYIIHGPEYNISNEQQKYEHARLPELISYLNDLKEKDEYKLQVRKKENFFPKELIKDALEYTCKEKFNLFMHMLICHADLDPENPLDDTLETYPLHYAAASGNQSAIAYLIHTCDVKRNVVDINGNNAAHYAYMYGRIETGNYLIENVQDLKEMSNLAGYEPRYVVDAYEERGKNLSYQGLSGEQENKIKEKLNEKLNLCRHSNERDLTTFHLELCNSYRQMKNYTFSEVALEQLLDYNEGEANIIYKEVVNLVQEIGKNIGNNNKNLKGKLMPVGSSADGTKLSKPEEFDFNWVLEWKNVNARLEEIPSDQHVGKGYTHKIVPDATNQEQMQLLSGSKLKDEFYHAVKEALPKLIKSPDIYFRDKRLSIILPGVKKTGVGVNLKLAWMGRDYKLLHVDVDLIPVIKITRPDGYDHPALTNNLSDSLKHLIRIASNEFEFSANDLHACYIHCCGDRLYRFSQALEENYIMLNLTKHKKNVFVISKYLVSVLKAQPWYLEKDKELFKYFNCKFFKLPAPQGFLLKSSFFRELDRVPEDENWHTQYYLARIKSIFLHMCYPLPYRDELLESLLPNCDMEVRKDGKLYSGKLPSYFAGSTQRPTAGFLAPTIFEFLNTMDINDIVPQNLK